MSEIEIENSDGEKSLIRKLVPNWKQIIKVVEKVLLGLIVLSILTVGFSVIYTSYRNYYRYDTSKDMELAYWNCKYQIVREMDMFMDSKSDTHNLSAIILLNKCDQYGIDIRLPLSQGVIESHFGTKGLASKTNSVFNMGAYDGWKLDRIMGIYKYPHPNKSIEPYLKTLKENYLGTTKTEADLLKNFVTLGGSRYASNPMYEQELRLMWEEINTVTKLDSLLLEYSHYKLELNR